MNEIKVKICGITNTNEIHQLDELGVDFAGVWWGIPKGKYNLTDSSIQRVMNVKTNTLKTIVVTLEHNHEKLRKLTETENFFAIQLQGFQLPSSIKKMRDSFHRDAKVSSVNNNILSSTATTAKAVAQKL